MKHNNKRVTETFNGHVYHFRSTLEYRWAQYLQILLESGEISDWFYEKERYRFDGYLIGAISWLPDFHVVNKDGSFELHECKGYHTSSTNTRLERMAHKYPDIRTVLVLQDIRKATAKRRVVAGKYCHRIIDASVIFRQLGGLIKNEPDGCERNSNEETM